MVAVDNELAAIAERLKAIEKTLSEYIAAVHSEEERDRELKRAPQLVRAEIIPNEASKREAQTEADRQHGVQNSIRRAAWAAFVAACLYAGLAAIQLNEMHTQTAQVFGQSEVENANASRRVAEVFQQLKIAQQQADAASSTAAAIGKAMQIDERAVMKVSMADKIQVQADGRIVALIQVTNIGKTTATNIAGQVVLELLDTTQEPVFIYRHGHPRTRFKQGIVFPEGKIQLPAMALVSHLPDPIPLIVTPDMQKRMNAGDVYIALHGRVTYDDIFGVHHWLTFCGQGLMDPMNPQPEDILRFGKLKGAAGCIAHNNADSNWN
jgi:hypothetical protein